MIALATPNASATRQAVAGLVDEWLAAATVGPSFRAALMAALALPRNILSEAPDVRWARLAWSCCVAAGGAATRVVPVAAASEIFMVALDLLDDLEDGEETPLHGNLGEAGVLNVATGLLLLAQHGLLALPDGAYAARLLVDAGLQACGGQHQDLTAADLGAPFTLEQALGVTAEKSASLVAVVCRLGAVAGGATEPAQELYARFGRSLGIAAQLANDLTALQPDARDKTDIALARPTLPLTYAALLAGSAEDATDLRTSIWTEGPAQLAWVVAETYRRRARDLVPALAADPATRRSLIALLDVF